MYRLYLFLFKYRVALIFIILESISFWLVVQNNRYQGAAFFNSANTVSANLLTASSEVRNYFRLRRTNADLAAEIARLRKQLEQKANGPETSTTENSNSKTFEFITGKVISNSIYNFNNYLTINVGSENGVKPDMGVVGNNGIVGKIKYTSSHYSVVTSLLHSNFLIASKVEGKINICSTQWDGVDHQKARLLYVPNHIELTKGDVVSTSGFNSIFPENIRIGTINEVLKKEGAPFYEIEILLSTDFANLTYVQVIDNLNVQELDSLDGVKQTF